MALSKQDAEKNDAWAKKLEDLACDLRESCDYLPCTEDEVLTDMHQAAAYQLDAIAGYMLIMGLRSTHEGHWR